MRAAVSREQVMSLTPGDVVHFIDKGGAIRSWSVDYVGRKYVHVTQGGHEVCGVPVPITRKRLTHDQVIRITRKDDDDRG